MLHSPCLSFYLFDLTIRLYVCFSPFVTLLHPYIALIALVRPFRLPFLNVRKSKKLTNLQYHYQLR